MSGFLGQTRDPVRVSQLAAPAKASTNGFHRAADRSQLRIEFFPLRIARNTPSPSSRLHRPAAAVRTATNCRLHTVRRALLEFPRLSAIPDLWFPGLPFSLT